MLLVKCGQDVLLLIIISGLVKLDLVTITKSWCLAGSLDFYHKMCLSINPVIPESKVTVVDNGSEQRERYRIQAEHLQVQVKQQCYKSSF